MPSLDIKRRADSVTESSLACINRYRTKPLPKSPAPPTRKGSYSLYPSCIPSTLASPPPASQPAQQPQQTPRPRHEARSGIRPPIKHRTSAPKMSTGRRSIDHQIEPLVDDFHSRLMFNPSTPSFGADALPGLDGDLPNVPSFGGAEPHENKTTRTLNSVRHHPTLDLQQHQRAQSDADAASSSSSPTTPGVRQGSSIGSASDISTAPSEHTLAPLQTHGIADSADQLETFGEDDPKSFDLLAAAPEETRAMYTIESRGDQLFSAAHLKQIFADPRLLLYFTSFLHSHRPRSLRILTYYLDTLKAIRAINYANAISDSLDSLHGHEFTKSAPPSTANKALEERAQNAFEALARDELPAYIAYTWIQVVSESMQRRITGTLPPHLREASEGLAEVFCLSDPSRPDNPIVFASEEFQRTTQYGMSYCVGRNCRFLQGPHTNQDSVRRIAEACRAGKEHSEVFLNYRRDGQPFMNLLMIAPLHDSQGTVRYFIGAQVDVSGLVKDSTDLEGLRRLVAREEDPIVAEEQDAAANKEEFQALSEMFNNHELSTIRKYGGRMHQPQVEDDDDDAASIKSSRPRLVLTDPTAEEMDRSTANMPKTAAEVVKASIRDSGRLQGVYQHYLLVRPAPSLRILFTSPSLRIPGILQTPFLDRVGGSSRVRSELLAAFNEGRSVTAKIRWLTRPHMEGEDTDGAEGRSRWIHCTPLLNHKGATGVWMVVLVDGESHEGDGRKRFRAPPSVPANDNIFTGARVNSKSSRTSSAASSSVLGGERERPSLNRKTSASSRLTIGGSPVTAVGTMTTVITGARSSRPGSPFTSPLSSPMNDTFRKDVQHVRFDDKANKF